MAYMLNEAGEKIWACAYEAKMLIAQQEASIQIVIVGLIGLGIIINMLFPGYDAGRYEMKDDGYETEHIPLEIDPRRLRK